MSRTSRRVEEAKRQKAARDMYRTFGPPEEWVISTEEIEKVMDSTQCVHGLEDVDLCEECGETIFLPALFKRQIELLALRMGCTPEVAATVAERASKQEEAR